MQTDGTYDPCLQVLKDIVSSKKNPVYLYAARVSSLLFLIHFHWCSSADDSSIFGVCVSIEWMMIEELFCNWFVLLEN